MTPRNTFTGKNDVQWSNGSNQKHQDTRLLGFPCVTILKLDKHMFS